MEEHKQAYADAFSAFLKGCPDDYNDMVELVECSSHLLLGERTGSPLTLLSVGSGTGVLDEMLLRGPLSTVTRYVAMEPNASHMEQLRERFLKLQAERKACGGQFELETWLTAWGDDGAWPESMRGCADIVLFSHCLYHLPKPEEVLRRAGIDLLRGEGAVVLALLCSDAALSQLWRSFRHRWCPLPSSQMADHGLNCSSVAAALREQLSAPGEGGDWKLRVEVSEKANSLDFRGAVDDPVEGSQVLSFLMSQDVTRLPEPLYTEMHNTFLGLCGPGGRFPHGNGLITLSRTSG